MLKKPEWLKTCIPSGKDLFYLKRMLTKYKLHTVCEDALCPNITECWNKKTLTFMILGDICTRNCLFCSVKKGIPQPPDYQEIKNIARFVKEMDIRYAIITSVTRDDLEDGGSYFFAEAIKEIKNINANIIVEVLIPDFGGNLGSVVKVISAKPDVLGHNIEVVPRFQEKIRSGKASYQRSHSILNFTKKNYPHILTKTGLMVGIGETMDEVLEVIKDLTGVVDILTVGQYLAPTRANPPPVKFYHPDEFKFIQEEALKSGIPYVLAGPLVRSSYFTPTDQGRRYFQ